MANIFNDDGTYIKTEWKTGDTITADKLDKIESCLEAINNNDIDRHVEAYSRLDALESVNADSRLDALEGVNADSRLGALEGEVEEFERSLNTNVEQLAHFTKYDVVTGLGCDNKGLIEIGGIIQSFLDSTSDTNINLYFPPGTYKWNITVSTNKTLFIGGERGNVIINNSGDLACLKHNGNCTINGLTFNTSSSNRYEFTVYSVAGGEFLCYDTIFSCTSGKINGLHVENTVISHIDRCKFNHSQISLRTWDCKITNTWVWALWRPYGIGIHGGSGNITINNVDVVPPFRTNGGVLNSDVLLDGIKAGIWINAENGDPTNNVIMENIYLDGNQGLNTGIGLLCEQVFGITLSSFRANKMSDYPIVIDSCYNVIVSKGVFYEDNKLDLEKNEILIKKTTNSKHDSITITSNQFINYTGTKTKPVPAIKVEDNANHKVSIIYNNICQDSQGKTYGDIEIVTPTMSDLNTNIPTRFAYKLSGSFVIPSGRTGVSLTLPNFMVMEPTQKNFRFWVDDGFLPALRVQKNTKNNVWIGVQTPPSSDITVYYEVNI